MSQVFGEERVIAFCDVYGDELPELIYKEYGKTYGCRGIDLCIATFDGTKVRDIYRWETIESDAAGSSSYYLFQCDGEKNLYIMYSWASEVSIAEFDRLEENEYELVKNTIVSAQMYPVYYGEPNSYQVDGQDTTQKKAREEVNRLKGDATQIITHNLIYDNDDYCNNNPFYFYDNEYAFVHSKSCNHMTYDEGVRYLNEQIAGLWDDPDNTDYKVGDIIKFGHYEQDGNTANGKEEIEWQVLKVESDRVLVVSKYCLDCKPYNTEYTDVTWETCTLRKWLNNDFKNAAFTSAEQAKIPTVNIANKNNPYYGTAGGNNTNDQIFCLSLEEMESYFGSYSWYHSEYMYGYNQNLICDATQYAINNGAYFHTITESDYNSYLKDKGYTSDVIGRRGAWWCLRSPGGFSSHACFVSNDGSAGAGGGGVDIGDFAVRPALYISNTSVVEPTEIKFDYDSLTLQKGETKKITATVLPENAYDKTVTWASNNPSIVSVDNMGNVKAVAPGSAIITAKTINDISKECAVKVIVNPTGISLNNTSATMYYGEKMTLAATLTPEDVTEKAITWTSNDEKVAMVNNGIVTAKSAGKATVMAKTVNGLTAKFEVTVFADNNPENIFADIKMDTWQYKAAKPVYDKGYMTGKGELEGRILFSPDTNIDRSQFVVALYSMDGKPETEYEQKFSDVKSSAWYAKQVTWASNNGIVAGNPDGTFGVYGKATREQLALMFYKYAMYKNYDVSVSEETNLDRFTDAGKVSSWAVTAIKWAVERGIISGKGSETAGYRIDPTSGATRAECAAMMNKFDKIYSDGLRMTVEDIEEPLALPAEEIEDISLPEEEFVIPEEEMEDDVDEEDMTPEENAEEISKELNMEEYYTNMLR